MHRFCKLVWILFVCGIVFFVICDEKWYKIWFENNHMVFEKIEKESDLLVDDLQVSETKIVYKNSDLIRINYEFNNPKSLRKSVGIDYEYLAQLENEKKLNDEKLKEKMEVYSWINIIALNDSDTISSVFSSWLWWNINEKNINDEMKNNSETLWESVNLWWVDRVDDLSWEIENFEDELLNTWDIKNVEKIDVKWKLLKLSDFPDLLNSSEKTYYKIDKYEYNKHELYLSKWLKNVLDNENDKENNVINLDLDMPELKLNQIILKKWKHPEIVFVEIEKYQPKWHNLLLKRWFFKENDFLVEEIDQGIDYNQVYLSDSMLSGLLEDDEIDISMLESENDEFLQKVFEKTLDVDVMNLIVENYLSEYQFLKAKKFIEGLPERYFSELNPLLNLRVAFNSFALTSKTVDENLLSLVNNYSSKISSEDKNRYIWVVALMDRNYDKFFEVSSSFTSEKNKNFTSKLQWYKDQISKQMWMPEYYFDTLVALELFNQWLFQPAKVLALYSLQQNSDYILPYQILAYANFLTNSWDTSVEYLKKLVDLDQNNAEKYRFLMWVAYYWAEKYEQSVTMLATIQNDKLRLDTQRYLINNYLKLDQKNKLISTWNKLLWYENLVASDFYTYFYESFFHPYSEWKQYQIFAFDTELANKMIRVCSIRLSDKEKVVCMYWTIGKNVALWKFEWLEEYLLDLTAQYPQWYLYQALWEYYLHHWEEDKAKLYLLKAVSMSTDKMEISQIKWLLQTLM